MTAIAYITVTAQRADRLPLEIPHGHQKRVTFDASAHPYPADPAQLVRADTDATAWLADRARDALTALHLTPAALGTDSFTVMATLDGHAGNLWAENVTLRP